MYDLSEAGGKESGMRTFAIGDIHGAYKALMQVLERAGFDYEKDKLICLGDVADGWPDVPACFDELLKIKNLVYVLGNHDEWMREWTQDDMKMPDQMWYCQGGKATVDAYIKLQQERGTKQKVPMEHRRLLDKAYDFYVLDDRCYVHGSLPIDGSPPIKATGDELRWDRQFWMAALRIHALMERGGHDTTEFGISTFKEVFIGHTSTARFAADGLPVRALNVWNLDQGAGWDGKLTIMNVETKEFWQSDNVLELYPNVKGRK